MSKKASVEIFINDEQARARFEEIQNELKTIKALKDKAFASGDVTGFNKLNTEMKRLTREATAMQRKVTDVDSVLKNLKTASIKQMREALAKANMELSVMSRSDPGFDRKRKQIQLLDAEIQRAVARTKVHGGVMDRLAYGFNKYFTMATAVAATLTGIAFSAKEWIKGLMGMDDALANVMKTTGLTRKEVRELYTEFGYLNTRTPRMELLALAEEAGRLGKKTKKEVMDFVEVGNMIKVALGDDLKGDAAEAIKEVGKLANIYNIASKYGTDFRQAMLMIGSAINEVSANSQAQAPFLIDMLKRLGGLADQANISAQNVVGIASALDQLGQTSEVSGTAINKTILNMFTDVTTYADIAKMSVDDFRNLLQTDANTALLTFLDGLNGNNEGLIRMAQKFDGLGLDGARAIQVLASLASNTNLVRQEQALANKALEEGVSLTNEYNIKNNNMAGSFEKIGQAIRRWFINSELNKALEGIVTSFARMVEIPIERKLQAEGREVAQLVGQLTDANLKANERRKIIAKLNEISPDLVKNLDAENLNYELLSQNVNAYNDALVQRIVLEKLTREQADILARAAVLGAQAKERELDIYEAIYAANIDIATSQGTIEEKIKRATQYLITQGASVDEFNRKSGISVNRAGQIVDNRSKEQKLLDDIINLQSSRNDLIARQNDLEAKAGPIQQRIEAFKEMLGLNIKLVETQQKTKTVEGEVIAETADAAKRRLDAERKAIESRLALLDESYEKELAMLRQNHEEKRSAIEQEIKFNKDLTAKDLANLREAVSNSRKLQQKEEEALAKQWQLKSLQMQQELVNLELSATQKGSIAEFDLKMKSLDLQQQIELAQVKEHETNKEEIRFAIMRKYERLRNDEYLAHELSQRDRQMRTELLNLIVGQEQELKVLNDRRAKGQISEKQYRIELNKLQQDYSRRSLLIAIDKAEAELKLLKAAGADVIDLEMEIARQRLEIQNSVIPGQKADTSPIKSLEAWHNAAIDMAQSTADAIAQINANRINTELDAQLAMLDRQRQAELKNKKLTEEQKEAINERFRKREAEIKLDAWKKQKQADIITSIIQTALAVLNQLAGGDPLTAFPRSIAAGVAGAAQTAVIIAQKPPQFFSGGYTRRSLSDHTYAGEVHANEFVVNARATANPTVRPVLDIINRAQESGAASSINLPRAIQLATANQHASSTDNNMMFTMAQFYNAVELFSGVVQDLTEKGVKANLIYQEIRRMMDKEANAINRTN
ncbi:MAG TPA: phage tail tape measure protein [Bacteroidales bacterium]|nr:phage tail tape measure protein [Bacteroidales bacterium]